MNVSIEGKEYPIRRIFGGEFSFIIPQYQRPYRWTEEHAGKLLDDLKESLQGESGGGTNPYFLGSLVLIKDKSSSRAEVVDGQQRLITLTILLAALHRRLLEIKSYKEESRKKLDEYMLERGSYGSDTPTHYRLSVRERDKEFFLKNVQVEGGLVKISDLRIDNLPESQQNMARNAILFCKALDGEGDELVSQFSSYLVNKCYLVAVTTPDQNAAYRIFSVLNDRGLNLSHADILKADIIGNIPDEQQDEYSRKWEDAEDALGYDSFKELFSHIRMIRKKAKLRDTVLKEFREAIIAPATNMEGVIDDVVLPYANAFKAIRWSAYEGAEDEGEVDSLLRWLNLLDNTDWVPPAMAYMRPANRPGKDIALFLKDLERLAAGMFILRYDINGRIERYGRILSAIDNNDDLYAEESPLQLTRPERDGIIGKLGEDIYEGQKKTQRYVLLRLDAALSQCEEVRYRHDTITIEHVLPQNPEEHSQWRQWFCDEQALDYWTNRLANLVLLSRRKNSEASRYEFDAKKERYFKSKKTGTSIFAITNQVLIETEWTPDVLERRQKDLIGKLAEVWRLT